MRSNNFQYISKMTTSSANLTCLLALALLSGSYLQNATAADTPPTSETPDTTLPSSTTVASVTAPASTSSTIVPVPSRAPSASSSSTTTTTTAATPTTSTTTTTPKPPSVVPNCPKQCTCTARLVNCSNLTLTEMPAIDPKATFVEFNFANNHLEALDFAKLPVATIERLDVSDNYIKTIVGPPGKGNKWDLKQLKALDLSDNMLRSAALAPLKTWRMPQITDLNLAKNDLERLGAGDLPPRAKLEKLDLSQIPELKSLDEGVFSNLTNLTHLNLSSSVAKFHLADQIFAYNRQLKTLDLSYNELVEVPVAIRSTRTIRKLILNGNSLTSLRRSDFINQQSLEHLEVSYCARLLRVEPDTLVGLPYLARVIISSNEKFFDFSPNALFSSDPEDKSRALLSLLDLSNNSLTTLADPTHPTQVQIQELRLANNPWNCDCSLKWLVSRPNQTGQQPVHCKTPFTYKDLEINQFFQVVDCQLEESSMQKLVLISFLLFLVVLTIAVFVQKTNLCRRLTWRDQYGTIYYTKASFPPEAGFTTDKV